jgi:S-(hydroxymethyl)glutathione dehydrogenase/alcohol dehydrogenase
MIVNMYMDGRIDIDSLIPQHLTIDQINEGFDLMTRGESIRLMVEY